MNTEGLNDGFKYIYFISVSIFYPSLNLHQFSLFLFMHQVGLTIHWIFFLFIFLYEIKLPKCIPFIPYTPLLFSLIILPYYSPLLFSWLTFLIFPSNPSFFHFFPKYYLFSLLFSLIIRVQDFHKAFPNNTSYFPLFFY